MYILEIKIKTIFTTYIQNILNDIFEQKNKYGFYLNDQDVYMKQIDKTRFEWLPKKQLTNTVVEFR